MFFPTHGKIILSGINQHLTTAARTAANGGSDSMEHFIEFLKEFIRDFKSLVLFVFVILIAIAIIGAIPFPYGESKVKELSISQRALFGLASVAWLLVAGLVNKYLPPTSQTPPDNPVWKQRFEEKQEEFSEEPKRERELLMRINIDGTRLTIFRGDITTARVDVIVSSDDNYFQAAGGVAKAILRKAGSMVKSELSRFAPKEELAPFARKVELGHLAVTSGGRLSQYIFHTVVLDLDQDLWPDEDIIRTATRNCLACGRALGLKSIAFPILGGGTASKQLTSAQSFQCITNEIANFVASSGASYEHIDVYVFTLKDVDGDPKALVENALRDARTSAT